MMNDYELAKFIVENLPLYLDDINITCSVVEMPKTNRGYAVGVKIDIPGVNQSPIIYTEQLSEALSDGHTIVNVMEGLAEMVEKTKSEPFLLQFDPRDYQSIKELISVTLVNTEANRDMLKNMPHRELADLSIISYIDIDNSSLGKGIIKITNNLFDSWGITKDELLDTAISNSITASKPVLQNVEKMFLTGDEKNYLSSTEPLPVSNNPGKDLYVLTNEERVYGASIIVNTDVLDKVNDLFPDGFYIIPSSIHEVLIVPAADPELRKELGEMVRSVNMTSCLEKDEVLSNCVYTYDRDSKTIHQVKESLPEKDVQPQFHQNGSFKDAEPKVTEINKDHDIKLN